MVERPKQKSPKERNPRGSSGKRLPMSIGCQWLLCGLFIYRSPKFSLSYLPVSDCAKCIVELWR